MDLQFLLWYWVGAENALRTQFRGFADHYLCVLVAELNKSSALQLSPVQPHQHTETCDLSLAMYLVFSANNTTEELKVCFHFSHSS